MTGGDVRLAPVFARRSIRDFLDVPAVANRGDPNWIAPLRCIERMRLDARRHPFYESGRGAFWVAYRGEAPVGRIGALVNEAHLARHHDGTAHFAMLEAIDDPAVFHALLHTAERWAVQQGLTRIAGPYNLSANEELGLLVDGFDQPPMVLMGHAQPYYAARLEAEGYAKAKDLYAFLDALGASERRMRQWFERAQATARSAGVAIRTATRRSFADDMRRGVALYNAAWAENWGFVPLRPREVDILIRDLRLILRPRHAIFAEIGGRLAGFIAGIPNLNQTLAGLDGRLFPFGLAKLAWDLLAWKFKSGRLLLLGVDPKLQGQATGGVVTLALLAALLETARSDGIRDFECSWILEDNSAMIKYCTFAGLRRYKTYRIYAKPLGGGRGAAG